MSNTPPPYSSITGISRAIMKDNSQETLSNYNGNARPGELVVNLETDPPALYIGNNVGELTQIGTGGSGLPLANGTSNFNIDTANGNVTVTVADLDTWTFDTNGTLTTPGDINVSGDVTGRAAASTLVLKAQPDSNTEIQLNNIVDSAIRTVANLEIRTNISNTAQTWTFDTTGNLTAPGNMSVTGNILANNIGTLEQLSAKYMIFDTMPLNNLPNPAGASGLRGFVNDANLVAAGNFGAQITDGGSNIVPVWSDGSVWRIG
jgi:hypothetical protein